MNAHEINFDLAVQIMDKNDLGFPLDSTYISLVPQIETIPEAGVLEVARIENGFVPCEKKVNGRRFFPDLDEARYNRLLVNNYTYCLDTSQVTFRNNFQNFYDN